MSQMDQELPSSRWGDPISDERRTALERILRQWDTELDHGTRRGPFDGVALSGADVFYLAARALAGPQGDVGAAATQLLATSQLTELPPLSSLHLEGARLVGAMLDGAVLAGAHLDGADLSGAHLAGAVLDEAQLMQANFTGASLEGIVLTDDNDYTEEEGGTRGGARPEGHTSSGETEHHPDSEKEESGEHIIFTGYYPREVVTQVWERLLVFLSPDSRDAVAQVASIAAERLQGRRNEFRDASAPSVTSIQRGAWLTIVPSLDGFRIEPAAVTAEWDADTQCYEFRLRAEQVQPDRAVNGLVQIFEGPLLRGEIPLAIFVQARGRTAAVSPAALAVDVRAPAYRNTFPSYSRKDEPLVRAFESVVEASGDRYLRDVRMLRAGERWEPRLLELINQADVFQLFWSQSAAESHQVEREWRHALTLASSRPNFIRPVYWTPKSYKKADELRAFNFAHIDPELLGFRQTTFMGRLFGRR